jgi:hypothetical protein
MLVLFLGINYLFALPSVWMCFFDSTVYGTVYTSGKWALFSSSTYLVLTSYYIKELMQLGRKKSQYVY